MKDFISKVTFGFIMAQLLPGAVVVFAITCAVKVDPSGSEETLWQVLIGIGEDWFRSTFTTIAFLFLAAATGMLIHGLNWTILSWLENKGDKPVRDWPWHKWPLRLQLLVSPVIMICEIMYLLFAAPDIESLTMEENVPELGSEKMEQFVFLQEFYLYFGQFYCHMAYALLVSTPFWVTAFLVGGLHWGLVILLALFLYFLTSVFFLLGRIQLSTMFKAEIILKNKSSTDESPPTAAGQ